MVLFEEIAALFAGIFSFLGGFGDIGAMFSAAWEAFIGLFG